MDVRLLCGLDKFGKRHAKCLHEDLTKSGGGVEREGECEVESEVRGRSS